MGSLIPSEVWDWRKHWPLVVKISAGIIILAVVLVVISLMS